MKHILVVEDNPSTLNLEKIALQKEFTVTLCESGTLSVKLLLENNFDLIILEVTESELYAYDRMKMVGKVPKLEEIPIILVIESDNLELQQKAIKAGAADVVRSPFAPEVLLNRVKTHLDLYEYRTNTAVIEKFQDAISVSLAELVECRDETTGGHIKNTTRYFKILLEEVNKQEAYKDVIPVEDIKDLLRAASLHDIGKIGINDEILRKASSLDYNEFEYMKTHTILGKETFDKIIKDTGGTKLLYLARDLAYCHHERWDGTGYPNGLKGEEIPFYARILTIADVYDALTSRRTYKEPFSHQIAKEIILEGKGYLFDPKLIDIFEKASESFEKALARKK